MAKVRFYLLPAALAVLTKEVSVIFPLFLLAYILVEKELSLADLFKAGKNENSGARSSWSFLPPWFAAALSA